ncbi:hypothetical protein SD70_10415 [Gordoniibacillus kamchatkensis]|uniref:NADP-dependent oxidoreductase domain-containing protein n=1 Tax=Gordoniibacillus kamchatkensis TaxID=1590651 RepID=A0ABR5AIH1_9BACL|nr:aldo/keto reductase [Paenibacillus sp. VKM B-2647]KIL40847.1 hypothetical protein SD70_10415 [Paenibacillus sp. VKM B-2647]
MASKGLEQRAIPRMNTKVTFIGFGALEIGRDWGFGDEEAARRPGEDEAGKVLNAVLDAGITLIDTAPAYHRSEERIGRFVSHRRSEYVLATKCGEHSDEPRTYYDFSYKAVKQSIDRSLQLLQTDVIDVMQIHFGPGPEQVLERGETVAAMKDARKEGKIRFLGASIDRELARRSIESGDFDVLQMNYNLLDRENEDNIRLAHERGIGVFIRGGLGMGKLSPKVVHHLDAEMRDKDKVLKLLELVRYDGAALGALALEFLYRNPGVSSVLVGSKKLEHVLHNLRMLETPVSESLYEQANRIALGMEAS